MGTHQLVLSRHLRDGMPYVFEPEHRLLILPGRDTQRYQIHGGDVLFMSRGTRNLGWAIEALPEPALAPVSFYVLRPHKRVLPSYLAWFLNQGQAQTVIDQIRTGAGTPIVQRKDFEQLEVVVPGLETQQRIVELGALQVREQELLKQLSHAVDRAHASVGRTIIDQLRPDGGPETRTQ
jgi:hypothetical protein